MSFDSIRRKMLASKAIPKSEIIITGTGSPSKGYVTFDGVTYYQPATVPVTGSSTDNHSLFAKANGVFLNGERKTKTEDPWSSSYTYTYTLTFTGTGVLYVDIQTKTDFIGGTYYEIYITM